ncbi:MAG: Undecaprenyl-phosphate galactosephosphotransferase [Rhizobacter sp.]|nr:Undecaprenyl-phosphate galactosephosphotransferase [Rhizobacter sp.]
MHGQFTLSGAIQSRKQAGTDPDWLDTVDRAWNQAAAIVLLALLSPIMAVIALMVWRSSGAPIFFGHYRVTQSGRLFRCLKFRSMYADADEVLVKLLATDPVAKAEWDRDQKLTNDPRITPIGEFLRRTSLDELPQLFNVLSGDMRLVGPRPITVSELTRYGNVRWHYLRVRPGMTGLWQVSGRNNTTYDERVAFDRSYVERRSLWLDATILLKTIQVVVRRDGAK